MKKAAPPQGGVPAEAGPTNENPGAPRVATWLLSAIVSEKDREGLLGDLTEEYESMASTLPEGSASVWYWDQAIRSVSPLLWADIRRGRWLKTLGAALAGYIVVGLLVIGTDLAMSQLLGAVGDQIYSAISLAVGFAAMMLGGYLAACMRPRAAIALAVFAALMGVFSLAITGDRAPLWYQIGLILIGPTAALTGGRVRARQRERYRL